MKNALFILSFILITFSFSSNAFETNESSPVVRKSDLKDLESIQIIRDFLNEVHEDLDSYYLISEKNLKLPASTKCELKHKNDVIKMFSSAIKSTLKFYPDEELPVAEALNDLRTFFNVTEVEVCIFSKVNKDVEITHTLFYSKSKSFFLRLDFFSPVE